MRPVLLKFSRRRSVRYELTVEKNVELTFAVLTANTILVGKDEFETTIRGNTVLHDAEFGHFIERFSDEKVGALTDISDCQGGLPGKVVDQYHNRKIAFPISTLLLRLGATLLR